MALDTVGVLTEYYPRYKERFAEDEGTARERLGRLLGMVLGGLANHRETVRQEALLVTGQYMFGSRSSMTTRRWRFSPSPIKSCSS